MLGSIAITVIITITIQDNITKRCSATINLWVHPLMAKPNRDKDSTILLHPLHRILLYHIALMLTCWKKYCEILYSASAITFFKINYRLTTRHWQWRAYNCLSSLLRTTVAQERKWETYGLSQQFPLSH